MRILALLMFLLFFFTDDISAAVIINEIFYDALGSDDNHEWIEIFNPDNSPYDLTNWKFHEGNVQHGLTLSQGTSTLSPNSFAIVAEDAQTFLQDYPNFNGNLHDSSFNLSNTGETISLLDGPSGNQVDSVGYSSSWGGGEGISLERISYSIQSNERDNWHNGPLGGSPGSQNILPSPTTSPTESSTPTATPTPTQTPTPTPAKTIYKINKSKDSNGQLISSVKIYVDNLYTHHEDDEILEFCDGCFCDDAKSIPCGYGEHTVKLTKTEYSDWSELRNFTQGASYEITPILTKISSEPTSTPTPTPTPTPSPTATPLLTKTQTPTPTIKRSDLLTPTASVASEILGASVSATPTEAETPPTVEIQTVGKESPHTDTFTAVAVGITSLGLLGIIFYRLSKIQLKS